MSQLNKNIAIAAILLMGAGSTMAADKMPLKVYDVDVTVNEQARTVGIDIELNLKDYHIGRNGEVIFTPILISDSGNDSIVMDPVTICGRNRWYYYMRQGALDNPSAQIYRSGAKGNVNIQKTLAFQPWMSHSTVEMRQQEANCCSAPTLLPGNTRFNNVLIATINTDIAEPEFDYVFAPPMSDAPVEKSVEGKAFVTFVVNRTELKPDYMDNPIELKKILNSIDIVKADPDAIITNVHIKGFASPEGPYDNNVRLAKGRTETLANYVNNLYKFEKGIMTTSYDPEDWAGLRSYVQDSMNYNITNRQAILEVIDGPLGFDAKDQALKTRFPQDYQVILKQIYPWLRHSDYRVKYNIKVYTDINELKRLYNSDPTKLRAVDFYTLAQEYKEGSPEYLAIMKKALEVYPDDPMINLNVANLYLMEGDFEKAQSCLLNAGRNPQSEFARGVLAAKRKDFNKAEEYFTLAKEGGIMQAESYLNHIRDERNRTAVTIDIETTKK